MGIGWECLGVWSLVGGVWWWVGVVGVVGWVGELWEEGGRVGSWVGDLVWWWSFVVYFRCVVVVVEVVVWVLGVFIDVFELGCFFVGL